MGESTVDLARSLCLCDKREPLQKNQAGFGGSNNRRLTRRCGQACPELVRAVAKVNWTAERREKAEGEGGRAGRCTVFGDERGGGGRVADSLK